MKMESSAFVAAPELIQALEKRSTAIACGADRVLFHQGDSPAGLYILNQGETTLTMTSPSGEQIMSIQVQAGSLLGLSGLISDSPYTLSAVASSGARLSFVPRDEFTSLMHTNSLLAFKMLEVLAAEVRSARSALSSD
ncbi:MAG: cyclic nucleotide-binding domain-containing protein [Terracidiphilus sp.]|jgi:CRP-like cAMP-binding protein